MDRYSFDNIIEDLVQVNEILTKVPNCIVFEDLKTLAQFYKHHQNTNTAISIIAVSIFDSVDYYEASASRLKGLCAEFHQLYAQSALYWDSFDFEGVCVDFLKPYKQLYEEAQAKATAQWRHFQSLSNRLDIMPFEDQDFKDLKAVCDTIETEYHARSKEVSTLYKELRAKEDYIAEVYFFKINYLVVLVSLWGHIVESLIKDIARIKTVE